MSQSATNRSPSLPGATSGHGVRSARSGPYTRLIVVDDHEAVRFGIKRALTHPAAAGIEVVGEAGDAAGLRSVMARSPCEVVVLDLSLGDGSDPAETIAWACDHGARVLIYSVADDPYLLRRALAVGVHGLARKSEPILTLIGKIRAAAIGELSVTVDLLAAIDGDIDFVEANLSRREQEVLVSFTSGLEISQIAARLFLTENSVKEYLRRIRAKYNVLDRPVQHKADLLRRAIEDGHLPPIRRR